MFTIVALKVLTNHSTGRRKLMPNKLYYFLDGFKIEEDGREDSKSKCKTSIWNLHVLLSTLCRRDLNFSIKICA